MGSKSNKAQAEAMARAAEEAQRARELLAQVELPDDIKIEQLISQLESPELVGLLQAEQMGETDLANIQMNPALKQQQMELLQALKQRADEGLTSEDKARMSEFRRMSAGDEQARQSSILQSMAERGVAGGGSELAARLASSQASADRESQAGVQMAGQASQARLAALQGASDQAGKIRSQDYGEQENVAKARDAIAQFNAMNRQSTAQQNLGERQRISEAQTGTRNLQNQQRISQEQQAFDNRYRKAGGQAQASQNLSGMYMQQAQMAPEKSGWGGAIGTLAGAGIGAMAGGTGGAKLGAQIGGTVGTQFKDGGKKMAYDDGGEGTIIPGEMYAGDKLPDRINSGEVVLNVKQQDQFMNLLKDYKRLKMLHDGIEKGKRIDDRLMEGDLQVNNEAQNVLMAIARGEMNPEDMPDVNIIESEEDYEND